MSAPELRGAFRESLQTLELLGVAHSFYLEEGTGLEGAEATALYDFFEGVIEGALPELSSVNVRISRVQGPLRIAMTVETDKDLSVLFQAFPGAEGTVQTFAMNDKCAAGTGRFFEAMANAFECSLEEFSNLSLTAKNVIPITAQCTVFAESEVITLVGEGKPRDEIAAGIQQAVAKRCFVMAKKAGAKDQITLTGGCAKNTGLKRAIEKVLRIQVVELSTDPQLKGALGAAEYARQKGLDQE